jgi:hypothetical protein
MPGLLALQPQAARPETPPATANAEMASPAKSYDVLLSNCEQVMVGVAKAMPADKYDFTPASLGVANFKFNGIRTFAQQVQHVAQQNYDFFSKVGRMKPDVDVDGIAKPLSKDEIVAALEASFAFAHKAVATLTIENASEVVPRSPIGDTRYNGSARHRPWLQSSRPARRVCAYERDRPAPGSSVGPAAPR